MENDSYQQFIDLLTICLFYAIYSITFFNKMDTV